MTMRSLALAAATVAALSGGSFAAPALAGSAAGTPPVFQEAATAAFGDRVEDELARRGARVALVARIGRDPDEMPDGLRYSHVAWWVYSEITGPDGRTVRGYVAHNLYQGDETPDRSTLVQDRPADFFRPIQVMEAAVAIPTPAVQARLLRAIADGTAAQVHVPAYSLVASPYDGRYQNCTEHALDLLIAALYGTADTERLKRIARQHFVASEVKVSPLARLFGPMVTSGLTLRDHDGAIRTTTFESIAAFMTANGITQENLTVLPDRPIAVR
jgi:hypothetical protein